MTKEELNLRCMKLVGWELIDLWERHMFVRDGYVLERAIDFTKDAGAAQEVYEKVLPNLAQHVAIRLKKENPTFMVDWGLTLKIALTDNAEVLLKSCVEVQEEYDARP